MSRKPRPTVSLAERRRRLEEEDTETDEEFAARCEDWPVRCRADVRGYRCGKEPTVVYRALGHRQHRCEEHRDDAGWKARGFSVNEPTPGETVRVIVRPRAR